MTHCKITIPQEIVKASQIDFSKPVYLYSDSRTLYLSNIKKKYNCFGKIMFDKEYSFTVSQNIFNTILKSSSYIVYVLNSQIFIKPYSITHKQQQYVQPLKLTIPSEILSMNAVDFNKIVYIYFSDNYTAYLSNRKQSRCCLGAFELNGENSFLLSRNICYILHICSLDDIAIYVSDNMIRLKST